MMIRDIQVVVVYQPALLRRSSMGTAGATTTCSSIMASKDAQTTLSIVLLAIYITKALIGFFQTQSRYDSNNEVPVDVKFVDFQSSFRFR